MVISLKLTLYRKFNYKDEAINTRRKLLQRLLEGITGMGIAKYIFIVKGK
jgi:hypothetical protein